MTTQTIINTFIDHYTYRNHERIEGSSILPPPDDPVLFVTSGMHPLIPYFEEQPHPQGRRLVNLQRCLRTVDLDEVGDGTHLTLFQMMGTWSLGDYDLEQSLEWGLELLGQYGISRDQLHITMYEGDKNVPRDESLIDWWQQQGFTTEQMSFLPSEDNWWGPVNDTGPCGPDCELFLWRGDGDPTGTPSDNHGWVEIWNHVNMSYYRHEDGSINELGRNNIDTGMGLERLVMVLQGQSDVYSTDMFQPFMQCVSQQLPNLSLRQQRILCDHSRTSFVLISEGIFPSNKGRGYVLRRMMRRCFGITDCMEQLLHDDLQRQTSELFRLPIDSELVRSVWLSEQEVYQRMLNRGSKIVTKLLQQRSYSFSEQDYIYLYETHGLPHDIVDVLTQGSMRSGDSSPDRSA